ncbi:ABC-three component system middle component 1 [Ruminiclostridium cellulolyticum]|uniref:Uncharacterized protein n=1 Tax=Ruminiclostridium cellulolyticum (strain ATCC 35319 / DSM 5812 / JCM 6584 / H10) TaxID=394503 RepID=B8I7F0_RUMCH|nr:ABC-three component system middle component 1 [Ruminiclostridium cellulolyticum]ACL77021.1 hypothetical protein Ccel_2710 [Ruminiclostridium cellulolyticum H10]
MSFEEYKQGVLALNCEDNTEWINKVTCWIDKEPGYNIYIFQVIVEGENDLEKYYETITAAIATEFQINLKKTIEKWNIYLVFECKKRISEELKQKIEQDKYSTRKMVWDSLNEKELGDKDYIKDRLLYLYIDAKSPVEEIPLLEKVKSIDFNLYRAIENTDKDINTQIAIYLGGDLNGQKD